MFNALTKRQQRILSEMFWRASWKTSLGQGSLCTELADLSDELDKLARPY